MGSLLTAGLLVECNAPLNGSGLAGGVGAGDADNVFLGDPGLFAQLVEIHLGNALAHGFETVDPVVAEFLVVELLVADDLKHGHGQSAVATRTDLQPVLARLGGDPGELRVDDGDLHATLHEVGDPVTIEAVGVGVEGLMAPDDAILGNDIARVVVTVDQELRAVHNARITKHASHRGDAGQVARVAGEVRDALVWRTHGGVHAGNLMDIAAGTLAAGDLVDAPGISDALEVLNDDVVGLVPGDALELVFAAVLAGALHRVLQALGAVHVIRNAQAAAAQTTLVVRVLGVTLDLNKLAVLDVGQDAANVVATRCRTRRAADDGHAVLFPRPRNIRSLGGRSRILGLGQARTTLVLLAVRLPPLILNFRHALSSRFSSV